MENEFEKKGIQFKVIEVDMIPDVVDFMWENFVPDEPLSHFYDPSKLKEARSWMKNTLETR